MAEENDKPDAMPLHQTAVYHGIAYKRSIFQKFYTE